MTPLASLSADEIAGSQRGASLYANALCKVWYPGRDRAGSLAVRKQLRGAMVRIKTRPKPKIAPETYKLNQNYEKKLPIVPY